jgi:integral membrane sensor domain MASE1
MVAACAGFVVYDLQAGLTLSSIAWFIPDLLEILIATLCLSHYFGGIPRLNRAKALTIFLVFAVILAPFTAAFVSAHGVASDYWTGWKICFFSEVLAFLTLTPAVFSWMSDGRAWLRKSRIFHLEAVALLTGLAFLSG